MAVELGSSSIAQELAMQAGISLHEPTALRRDHTVGLEVRSRRLAGKPEEIHHWIYDEPRRRKVWRHEH